MEADELAQLGSVSEIDQEFISWSVIIHGLFLLVNSSSKCTFNECMFHVICIWTKYRIASGGIYYELAQLEAYELAQLESMLEIDQELNE